MTSDSNTADYAAIKKVDVVRASRDGHSYHEAWAARSALQLLPPKTNLSAIAVEGFRRDDEDGLSSSAMEIADLVRYHGGRTARQAALIEVIQFKYSISDAEKPIRAAGLAKTLRKFSKTDRDLRDEFGDEKAEKSVRYVFSTNRPIHANLSEALTGLTSNIKLEGDAKKQADQLKAAVIDGIPLLSILRRLDLQGSQGSLRHAEQAVRRLLYSWGEASDLEANIRLLKLQRLMREKAGFAGQGNNHVERVDVLAELGIDHEDALYPTPDAFPPVANPISRPIAKVILETAVTSKLPILIHGAGGTGKTVLMQAVADHLPSHQHAVVFDGFGAGKWRDPEDGRHLPNRTLVHLANLLAGEGLCDLLLPTSDVVGLVAAFRRRLVQAVGTLRKSDGKGGVVLILDAIDHAGMEARDTGSSSFAHLILKSFSIEPVEGVTIISSCRTERRELAIGSATVHEIEVPAFSDDEVRDLVLARDPTATPAEIAALNSRSGRNPRCLDGLLVAGRPYDGERPGGSDATDSEVLDALLFSRIESAKNVARSKGVGEDELNVILSGLSLLPPPVPLDELAAAHGMDLAAVESFASDLAPLLERTPSGLMFRDEPTETLIRSLAKTERAANELVIERLTGRQAVSDYACRALPSVLVATKRVDELFSLAFDKRVPPSASKVSQRDIRMARLNAAIQATSAAERYDELIKLLLEASIVGAGHERSDRFLYEYPDLVAVSDDHEALRRLLATKFGWPGGRHSALSLAYAIRGEWGEAQRNSSRAIDWLNWAHRQKSGSLVGNDSRSDRLDEIGFTFTEMLSGNEDRVAIWFGKRNDNQAFDRFSSLLDLLERQDHSSCEKSEKRAQILDRLMRCKLESRSLVLAALRFSPNDPELTRSLLGALAGHSRADQAAHVPISATLSATAQALKLGMKKEAKQIIFEARRPSVHDFSSYWPTDARAERMVVQAGISALIRSHPPTFLDLAPSELVEAVPKYVRRKGSAAFEAELPKRLSAMAHRYRKNARRGSTSGVAPRTLSPDSLLTYENAIKHRIRPLLPYARLVGEMISPPSGMTSCGVLDAAISQLRSDIAGASSYPYRDQKEYMARVGVASLFQVGDAIGAFNSQNAGHLVSLIKEGHGLFTPALTNIVTRFSRTPDLHDAALDLAAFVESLIVTDTDINSRISAYGDLARAVWRVGSAEAAAYFRRALDLAEAVGSDDFDRTNYLLALTAEHSGSVLDHEAAHNLARILELNQHEPHKFPWAEFARSLAPISGISALALISRLDDRDHIALGATLPPMLGELVERGQLSADLATCLLGLDEPGEAWNWRLDHLAEILCNNLAPEDVERLFEILLTEIDRSDRLAPWSSTIGGLKTLAEKHLDHSSPAFLRIRALAARNPPEEPYRQDEKHRAHFRFAGIDFGDSDAIDAAIENDTEDDHGRKWPLRTLAHLAENVRTPKERLDFVRALTKVQAASLSDKVKAIEDHLENWAARSNALRYDTPRLAIQLASKHAPELVSTSWENSGIWRTLTRAFRGDPKQVVSAAISALGRETLELSGNSWLSLASRLAPVVSREALGEGLNHYLLTTGNGLPDEVGDGPWNDAFRVLGEDEDVVAMLIWSRLGSMNAGSRWRAAHAVRRLIDIGRIDVVDKIVGEFDGSPPSAFLHIGYPFYKMHAQLWLLIALARVSRDQPQIGVRWRRLLSDILDSPHIVMRHFAAQALARIASVLPEEEASELRSRLTTVNQSPFPIQNDRRHTQNKTSEKTSYEDRFSQEYDFKKYVSSDLTTIFGIPESQVDRELAEIVHAWDANVSSMYECPRSRSDDYSRESGSATVPARDRYGAYLGWHGVMHLAGKLLASQPIVKGWQSQPWESFISDLELTRPDGLWLSDITDRFPLDLPTNIDMPEKEDKGDWSITRSDRLELAEALNWPLDGHVTEEMIVSGYLAVREHLNVSVRSVLVPPDRADCVALAVLTESKFFQWLPCEAHDEDWEYGQGSRVHVWLEMVESHSIGIDRNDPYAASSATSRPLPSAWLQRKASLEAGDSFGGSWTSKSKPAFRTEAWGSETRRYRESVDIHGDRIFVDDNFLREFLEETGLALVAFAKAQKYISKQETGSADGDGSFRNRTVVLIIEPGGKVRPIARMPKEARNAVQSVSLDGRADFRDRFAVLSNLRS